MLYKNVRPLKSLHQIAVFPPSLFPPSSLPSSLFAVHLAGKKKYLKLLHTSTTPAVIPSASTAPSPASSPPASPAAILTVSQHAILISPHTRCSIGDPSEGCLPKLHPNPMGSVWAALPLGYTNIHPPHPYGSLPSTHFSFLASSFPPLPSPYFLKALCSLISKPPSSRKDTDNQAFGVQLLATQS
ncbi:hypothetical protein L211DRAFT_719115 [Terfezia boudieri ATCC MYA-4762]|uniref:Uncharacterized protein n=1 Tax=Terfezia boudieri ATCC MYA-4762 TaxID=1051890 RepID=A0A3N4L6U4_9PEZI|nr:hypothetical protein L211DRAFT_719115 [Terfezia boudieri ATCC MYA-4762]